MATILATTIASPAAAGPADASCVYLAIGCAPNGPLPYPEAEAAADEPAPDAPLRHHRRDHVRRHRTVLHATF